MKASTKQQFNLLGLVFTFSVALPFVRELLNVFTGSADVSSEGLVALVIGLIVFAIPNFWFFLQVINPLEKIERTVGDENAKLLISGEPDLRIISLEPYRKNND